MPKYPDEIQDKFKQPKGWRWHHFKRDNRTIRFGSVSPENKTPDAVIVCLQGVREFTEKYYETAQWCLDNNFAFWMMDWAGQGKSTRFLDNPQKRHSLGFDEDIKDLHQFIMDYIKHSSVSPDVGRIPMALLAHSMGANIAMRYLEKHQDIFECAALSAPMIGIKAFRFIPAPIMLALTGALNCVMGKSYVPLGKDWAERTEHARLSSNKERNDIDEKWCNFDPELQIGDITFGWVHEAQKSCVAVQKHSIHAYIPTPCLIGIPGHEDLVDNKKTEKVAAHMPSVKIVDYPNAYHEILMESDEIRGNFLSHFRDLIKETIIDRPETLKPF